MPAPPPRFAVDDVELAEAYLVVGDVCAPRRVTRPTDRTHVLVWASRDGGRHARGGFPPSAGR